MKIHKMQYENLISRYPRTEKTIELITRQYTWHNITKQFNNISQNAKPVVEIRTLLKIYLDL
jgi:hypothetical protein